MNKLGLLLLTVGFAACSSQTSLMEAEQDAQGCVISAGQSWSQLRQECLPLAEVADIQFHDSEPQGAVVYALLSEDRQQAELFAADIQGSLLLEAVKGGYRSVDGRHYLQRQDNVWRLRRALP